MEGGIRLIDEDVSRRTIAVSIKATKLTGPGAGPGVSGGGPEDRQTSPGPPDTHGKQTVRQLMGHGAAEQHRGGSPKGL